MEKWDDSDEIQFSIPKILWPQNFISFTDLVITTYIQ